jgi:hypothetical protein
MSVFSLSGAVQQLGETGVALATLAIGIQNFVSLWWLKKPNLRIALAAIAIQWIFVVVFVAVGFDVHTHPSKDEYYAIPTRYWCWLGEHYFGERLAGEYLWLWITLFVSTLLYIPLFLWYLGKIGEDDKRWYKPNRRMVMKTIRTSTVSAVPAPQSVVGSARPATGSRQPRPDTGHSTQASNGDQASAFPPPSTQESQQVVQVQPHGPRELQRAIWYPIVYCFVIIPLSVVRWVGYHEEDTGSKINHIPDGATFFAIFVFALSGVLNACLYLLTRARFFWTGKRDPSRV